MARNATTTDTDTDTDTQTAVATTTDSPGSTAGQNGATNYDAPVDFGGQVIDFEGVSTEYAPCEKGVYAARCTDAQVRIGQQSNAPYINIEWTILQEPYENRKVWNSASLLPQTLWRLKGDMVKIGVDPTKLNGKMTIEDICYELNGREADLSLDIESYTGNDGVPKKRNKVAAVNPIGSAATGYATQSRAF
jgi:hypothetical protein